MTRHKTKLLAPVALLAIVAGLVLASAAAAGETKPVLAVRSVDSTDPGRTTATVLYTGDPGDVDAARLVQNGSTVDVQAVNPFDASTPQSIALIFEISDAMDDSGALVAAKDGARRWMENLPGGAPQRVAVITAADKAELLQGFTTDRGRVLNAIDRVAPAPTEQGRQVTALWSAVRLAATELADERGAPSIVAMTSQGATSSTDAAAARGAVATANALTFVLDHSPNGKATSGLESMVTTYGGEVLTAEAGAEMEQLVGDAQRAVSSGQYELVFASQVGEGEISDLVIEVGDTSKKVSFVAGESVAGQRALTLSGSTDAGGVTFLQTPLGLGLTVLFVLLAVGGLAYGVASVAFPDDQLSSVLEAYTEPFVQATGADEDDEGSGSLAKTAIIQRAVEMTEQVAAERGILARAETALERANLPLRAAEALFFYAAAVVILTVLALALTGSVVLGLFAGILVALLPIGTVNFLAARRRKKFMSQLPDTLQLLSGTLRAGYSLMQGVEAVSQEVDEPMGVELRRVVTESRLGRPLEEALEGTAERMNSPDFAWAVMAIRIQREVGGNLSELLMTVSETMVARERLRRDVRTLTAEGRLSAIVLGGLPPGLGLVMWVLNPSYMESLLSESLGHILLILAAISMGIGFYWMKRIISIEI
jgi:tight adherence protein B